MKIANVLRNRNINVTEMHKLGTCLRKQWEDTFANHMSSKEKEEIHLHGYKGTGGYLWHLFSYKKRDCLQGHEAEEAFNNEHKSACYIFYQHTDYALTLDNAEVLNPKDLQEEYDIYVVDKEFNWTYVKTHETGWCGPYFSRKDTKK